MTPARLHDLQTAGLKLVDVGARGLFMLMVTFSLEVTQAGQFGLIAVLVSLFSFAFNFERHLDVQRRGAGQPAAIFDRLILEAVRFSAFNWLIMLPSFVVGVILLAKADGLTLLLASLIVVGEHMANQGYYAAMLDRRYRPFLVVVGIKNVILLGVIIGGLVAWQSAFDLNAVMQVWAGATFAAALIQVALFRCINRPAPREAPFAIGIDIVGQHRASLTHFLIGLVAILMLQYDRLIVGALMPLSSVGIYLRHLVLISLAYQVFSVVSFNRMLPRMFETAKLTSLRSQNSQVVKEHLMLSSLVVAGFIALLAANTFTDGIYTARYDLSLGLIAVLLVGFLIRARADFAGLILNAHMLEREVLRNQLIGAVVGGILLSGLTWTFGLWGAACATLVGQTLYLALNLRASLRIQT